MSVTVQAAVSIGTDTRDVIRLTAGETIVARIRKLGSGQHGPCRVGDALSGCWLPYEARLPGG